MDPIGVVSMIEIDDCDLSSYFLGVCVQNYDTSSGRILNVLAHERLAIVDPHNGAQPLYDEQGGVALTVNGEIWNHRELRAHLAPQKFATESDCEPILYLYKKYGDEFVDHLDGIFAFCISDSVNNTFLAARDPIGVCSMYVGWGRDGSMWFASEMKTLIEDCENYMEFPPGHYW